MNGQALVIGYGNALCGDDGIGPAVANEVAMIRLAGVRTIALQQLTPEIAADVADAARVIFVDVSIEWDAVRVVRLQPRTTAPALSHALDAPRLLALALAVYGRCPPAWMVTVGARDMTPGAGLSPASREYTRLLRDRVIALLRQGLARTSE